MAANTVEDVIHALPTFINVAVQYLRPKQTAYIRETLQGVVREVVNADDLDLESDPCIVGLLRERFDKLCSKFLTIDLSDSSRSGRDASWYYRKSGQRRPLPPSSSRSGHSCRVHSPYVQFVYILYHSLTPRDQTSKSSSGGQRNLSVPSRLH